MSDRHRARRSKILYLMASFMMLITTMGAKIHHQLKYTFLRDFPV